MWWAMWIPSVLILGALVALGIWAVRRFSEPRGDSSARRILEERFARGEIDADEFRSRLQPWRATRSAATLEDGASVSALCCPPMEAGRDRGVSSTIAPQPVGCAYSVHAREQGIWTRGEPGLGPVEVAGDSPTHQTAPLRRLSGRRSGLARESSRPASPQPDPAESGRWSPPLGARPLP
jgi:putative membrane protein